MEFRVKVSDSRVQNCTFEKRLNPCLSARTLADFGLERYKARVAMVALSRGFHVATRPDPKLPD